MIYRLPLAQWVNQGLTWVLHHYARVFAIFSAWIGAIVHGLSTALYAVPWWVLIIVIAILAWRAWGWRFAIGSALGLFLIFDLSLWHAFLDTLVLVVTSAFVSIVVGVPLGVLAARSRRFHQVFTPLLDFMQTMPSFVYLIPALMLFGLGTVPSVFATVVFAMPPAVRFTDLGIRQVPADLVEVGESFGSSPWQMLTKIQLPLALPTIMGGINQTMMLSLSMVVIAAMIGAGGFGQGVLYGISRLDVGTGFINGLGVVILAIILDRLTQGMGRSAKQRQNKGKWR